MTFNAALLDDYRTYCGGNWPISGFVLDFLLRAGLRRQNSLIDVGCGPLRIGKHLITFLDAGCYTGLEPEGPMLNAGITYELSTELRMLQRPTFLVEPIGTREIEADWALGWDVFNHLSRKQLRLALETIHAKRWLMNIHMAEHDETFPTNGEGWSYRFAETRAEVYSRSAFHELVADCRYEPHIAQMVETDWPSHPFAIVELERIV